MQEDLPDSVQEFKFPAGSGMGLWFDHDSEPWSNRKVRKALVHSIDLEGVVEELAGIPKRVDTTHTGLTAAAAPRWLASNQPEGFSVYDGGPSAGSALLADAGYDPGDIDVEITYPTERNDWAVACRAIVDQLQSAGWNASGNPVSRTGPELVSEGETDLVAYQHKPSSRLPTNGAFAHHPYFALEFLFQGDYDEAGHFSNYDPGSVVVDGDPIDVDAELDRLTSTTSRAEQRPIVERLSRVVNHDIPCVIVMEKVEQSFIDTLYFDIPDSSPHFRSRWPQWWLPKVEERMENRPKPGLLKYNPAE